MVIFQARMRQNHHRRLERDIERNTDPLVRLDRIHRDESFVAPPLNENIFNIGMVEKRKMLRTVFYII